MTAYSLLQYPDGLFIRVGVGGAYVRNPSAFVGHYIVLPACLYHGYGDPDRTEGLRFVAEPEASQQGNVIDRPVYGVHSLRAGGMSSKVRRKKADSRSSVFTRLSRNMAR